MQIDLKAMQNKFSNHYLDYEDDLYLLHKNKVDYVGQFIQIKDYSIYYDLDFDFSQLDVDENVLNHLATMKANRKRLISQYIVNLNHNKIERVKAEPFTQNLALTNNAFDYRKNKRKFKELPEALFDDDLRKMIFFALKKIQSYTQCGDFKLTAHHTFIFCQGSASATNSPEGIHQDGMDFIMSAFVVERKNVKGAKSIVYAEDKETKIFEAILKDGQGLLQADLHSSLWHEVTQISPLNPNEIAYRSSIGFDIECLK